MTTTFITCSHPVDRYIQWLIPRKRNTNVTEQWSKQICQGIFTQFEWNRGMFTGAGQFYTLQQLSAQLCFQLHWGFKKHLPRIRSYWSQCDESSAWPSKMCLEVFSLMVGPLQSDVNTEAHCLPMSRMSLSSPWLLPEAAVDSISSAILTRQFSKFFSTL